MEMLMRWALLVVFVVCVGCAKRGEPLPSASVADNGVDGTAQQPPVFAPRSEPVAAKEFHTNLPAQAHAAQFPSDDWTHRDLVTYLGKKGITLSIKSAGLILNAGLRPVAAFAEGEDTRRPSVLVFLCSDARAAHELAATMGDGAFSFGRFALGSMGVDGSREKIDDAGLLRRLAAILK
jgi:hypothetical protein